MKTHLRYDMLADVKGHPQKVMKDLGITYKVSTPQSMGDQWWFWCCENVPDPLPDFLEVLDLNPYECVGNGLSIEEADIISGGYDHFTGHATQGVLIAQLINQVQYELIGGVWTDEKGKIHFVGLIERDGQVMVDFPDMGNVYISDVAQVGLLRC